MSPETYRAAAELAASEQNYEAAMRLELSGKAKCIGHQRAERHYQRAERYAETGGFPFRMDFATDADKRTYVQQVLNRSQRA